MKRTDFIGFLEVYICYDVIWTNEMTSLKEKSLFFSLTQDTMEVLHIFAKEPPFLPLVTLSSSKYDF